MRLGAFDVSETTTGRDALARVRERATAPDLVVLDVMLPDLDGFEVCKRMRADGVDVPVLFLTALDATEDRLRGLTIGGDDYLSKPFSVEELVARIRVILRRIGKGQSPRVVRAGCVELDDDAHVVRRNGDAVALSPTEYKLLRFLMLNPGRALSHAARSSITCGTTTSTASRRWSRRSSRRCARSSRVTGTASSTPSAASGTDSSR